MRSFVKEKIALVMTLVLMITSLGLGADSVFADETSAEVAAENQGRDEIGSDATAASLVEDDQAGITYVLNISKKTIELGDEIQLELLGVSDTEAITWKTSKKAVATVEGGLVTSVGVGSANIYAYYNDVRYKCKVTVKQTAPALVLSVDELSIGDQGVLSLTNAKASKYYSDDKTIAAITKTGTVTAVRAGKTTLHVKDSKGKIYDYEITIYDRSKNEPSIVAKQLYEDDLWLTKDVIVGSTTFARSTGVKLLKETSTSYTVSCRGITFTIVKSKATDQPPAAVPITGLKYLSYDVKPGMLVNYTNNIMSTGNPNGLIALKDSKITKRLIYDDACKLQKDMIGPLSNMIDDCYKAGVKWFQVTDEGAYRTYSMQNSFWKTRIAENPTYGDDPYSTGGTKCVPGTSSEHRTGFAIDLRTTQTGYDWLNANCYKYGFILRYTGDKTQYTGVMDEYWHYTYVGVDVATTCYTEELCLEEYYEKYVFAQ